MNYQAILVHVDASSHAAARIGYAITLARGCGAHLIGAAMTGLPRSVLPEGVWPRPGTLEANCFEHLYRAASDALAQFSASAAAAQVACEQRLVTDQDADALALLSRFCDLLVVGQDDPQEALPGHRVPVAEYVALNASAPVLVVPHQWRQAATMNKILVAWNGSAASARAVHAALPVLRQAAQVHVATFCAPDASIARHHADEQTELANWLARHGIAVQACVRDAQTDTGHAILALAHENGCDLVVMGCYGHSRFREILLGGASRTILRSASVPVLMAH